MSMRFIQRIISILFRNRNDPSRAFIQIMYAFAHDVPEATTAMDYYERGLYYWSIQTVVKTDEITTTWRKG